MSVAWTQDGDGKYLVESAQHLLQIMNKGALGTDTGTPPADYWAASYLQTSDIDLANDHASIVPIGVSGDRFTGVYDGGLFRIANWSYTVSSTVDKAGLFGHSDSPAVLKHIRLTGAWTLSGDDNLGFLAGYLISSQVYDIQANFDTGTTLTGDSNLGGIIGAAFFTSCREITLRGTVDFSVGTYGNVGGLMGYIADGSEIRGCRNLGTFPNGISGFVVGGIAAYTRDTAISTCVNAMQGNLTSTSYAGGICGTLAYGGGACDSLVNSMVGDLGSTYGTGGIFGRVNLSDSDLLSCTKILNYMKGNITVTTASAQAGGIVGYLYTLTSGGDPSAYGVVHITKSVVAIQGAVDQTVCGQENAIPAQVEVAVDTTFGMTYNGNEYGQSSMVVDGALLYHPDFADLPYVDMSGTDPDGILYDWDFVYANIGGKYPEYTHLSVHTAVVSAPYYTDFGLADNNDAVYLTYANTDTNTLFHSASLTIVQTAAANIVQLGAVASSTVSKSDFFFEGENVYDISEAGTEVATAVNELFATGDRVAVTVNSAPTTTTFVNRGGQIDIAGANAILLPFDPTVADVQDATFTLSDATSVDVGFDQASGNIVVDGTAYSAGDYFILDGQKVRVFDI